MTELFVDSAERLGDGQVSVFETVILKLAQSVETAARASLSESVADISNAPRSVVRDLAYDADITVAGPVLSRSAQVAEGDLIRIAEERGQDHLQAISRRRSLSERVTNVLVSRGEGEVLRSVARNEGAQFSSQGFDTLSTQGSADPLLKDILLMRRDIPAIHRDHLVETAKTRVSRKLAEEFGGDAATLAVSRAARAVAGESISLQEAAIAVDGWLAGKGAKQPEETDLVTWLAQGRVMEAIVGLARAAGMPAEMVLGAYQGAHSDPLLFLIRSLRFGWGTFKAFLISKTGKEPPPEETRGHFEAFQALSVATAQRVVRFTAAREQLQKAG
ncbi:DUF2336 domain-containing protein [Methylobacterium gnaphalii]|uniref:DUF2336 domain-containing protein n=1 Tax=Methylobacterium gnaphalii TaxID=1010610 RepID=A0A512JKD9_9HYPH|nr:DUF2336 domain-containing protein [Methylobacterium gnaphalii]GEP10426.1 hypothetical protein MGN01_22710 [Methylobacterium gnaphalii]GLS47764.1 hypothetical protein GCM10007885_06080 [Methylobacterium gnaphalii]